MSPAVQVYSPSDTWVELPEKLRRLPAPARAIAEDLFQANLEAKAAGRAIESQISMNGHNRHEMQTERHRLITRNFEPLSETDPAIIKLDREIEACSAAMQRLNPRAWQYSDIANNLTALLTSLERYVGSATSTPVEPMQATPALANGESFLEAIEKRRRRLRELHANIDSYKAAPIPSSIALEREIERIDALAAAGAPYVLDAVETGGPVVWPMYHTDEHVRGGVGSVRIDVPDGLSIIAHLFRDQMVAAVTKAIQAAADDDAALTLEQRVRLIAEAERDALAVQREEIALIGAAKAAGHPVSYRSDTDPRAVLGLADKFSKPSQTEEIVPSSEESRWPNISIEEAEA